MRFTALLHRVTVDLMKASFFVLKREASPGVDGMTWQAYATGLDARLKDLHDRVHRGTYRAQPSKRAYIPKVDGRLRPLGIAALEDNIVQRALATVLNEVYEADFLGFSYGFRPGRSQHQALDALSVGLLRKRVNSVLDADVRGFCDHIDHGWLMQFVAHRIADLRVLRLIHKWLQAGVSEDGRWSKTEVGTPQGAAASPPLADHDHISGRVPRPPPLQNAISRRPAPCVCCRGVTNYGSTLSNETQLKNDSQLGTTPRTEGRCFPFRTFASRVPVPYDPPRLCTWRMPLAGGARRSAVPMKTQRRQRTFLHLGCATRFPNAGSFKDR